MNVKTRKDASHRRCPDCVETGLPPLAEPRRKPAFNPDERRLLALMGKEVGSDLTNEEFCAFVRTTPQGVSREATAVVRALTRKGVFWVTKECKDDLFVRFTQKGAQALFAVCFPEAAAALEGAAHLERGLAQPAIAAPSQRRLRL